MSILLFQSVIILNKIQLYHKFYKINVHKSIPQDALLINSLKEVFCRFLFLKDFFNIDIYCRKFNAKFNKLIKH